jgi:hypothetical protein
MAIFPVIESESIIQINDKTRIDVSKTFISKGEAAVEEVEIEPEAGAGFISVFAVDQKQWFLDWQYSGASRTVVVSARVTTDGLPVTTTKEIEVITASDDKLFSSDADLISLEPDILKRVKPGRSSFLDIHRMAQTKILEYLDEAGIRNTDNTKVTEDELLDISEVRPWSRDLTLHLIFNGFSNQVDDIFFEKSKHYKKEAENRADRVVLAFDSNKDGILDKHEGIVMRTRELIRE